VRRSIAVTILVLGLVVAGCTPLERSAYNAAVAGKAFLDKEKAAHSECASGGTSTLCSALSRGTAVKDSLLDAIAVYCAGPTFDAGGACNPPAKGTPAATQATAKLQAAMASWNQVVTDIKAAGGK